MDVTVQKSDGEIVHWQVHEVMAMTTERGGPPSKGTPADKRLKENRPGTMPPMPPGKKK